MNKRLPEFLLSSAEEVTYPQMTLLHDSYLERSISSISMMIRKGLFHTTGVDSPGLFQGLDARVKFAFLALFLIITSLKHVATSQLVITVMILCAILLSRLQLGRIIKYILPFTFFFGFLIALPASLNVITPGTILWTIVQFHQDNRFWIYHIPRQIGFTYEGLAVVILLTLKVMNSLALSWLVLSTTPLSEIMRVLKAFRVPDSFLLIVNLANHYIFTLSRTIEDMYRARLSRTFHSQSRGEGRMWVAGRMAHIFEKSIARYSEVYKAIQGRGLSDTYRLPGFSPLTKKSSIAGLAIAALGILFLII
jgi:cobalt ECF transporter T component CbiQ